MIKIITENKKQEVLNILLKDKQLNQDDLTFTINNSNEIMCYVDDNKMIGFLTYRLWGNKTKADIYIYVLNEYRKHHIALILFNEIKTKINDLSLKFISTKVETNINDSLIFYEKLKFKPWYIEKILQYNGGKKETCNVEMINYSSKYFT